MEIKLTDRYKIVTDPLNYALVEVKVCKDEEAKNFNKEYNSPIAYCRTLSQAIGAIVEHHIKTSELTSMKELSDYIHDFRSEISKNLDAEIDRLRNK